MAKSNRNIRRPATLKRIGLHYHKKFKGINTCVYCGEPASGRDHVLAVSIAGGLDLNNPQIRKHLTRCLCTVPCCTSCNTTAGNELFYTILSKRKYIQQELRRKNLKLLRSKLWSSDELEEVGDNFKSSILSAQFKRFRLEKRIYYPFT